MKYILAFLVAVSLSAQAQSTWKMHIIDNASNGADGVKLADINHDGRLFVYADYFITNTFSKNSDDPLSQISFRQIVYFGVIVVTSHLQFRVSKGDVLKFFDDIAQLYRI